MDFYKKWSQNRSQNEETHSPIWHPKSAPGRRHPGVLGGFLACAQPCTAPFQHFTFSALHLFCTSPSQHLGFLQVGCFLSFSSFPAGNLLLSGSLSQPTRGPKRSKRSRNWIQKRIDFWIAFFLDFSRFLPDFSSHLGSLFSHFSSFSHHFFEHLFCIEFYFLFFHRCLYLSSSKKTMFALYSLQKTRNRRFRNFTDVSSIWHRFSSILA